MTALAAIALSGMNVAQTRLHAGAHNIANLHTEGFRREIAQPVTRATGGVDVRVGQASSPGHAFATDVVGQLEAKHAFLANLAVFRASDRMAGSLLDALA